MDNETKRQVLTILAGLIFASPHTLGVSDDKTARAKAAVDCAEAIFDAVKEKMVQ